MHTDIFISYCRKDTEVANIICEALDRAGITFFIDRQGIGGGQEFPAILADAICESKLFLYLASNNSYESKYTDSEITFAFNEKPRETILPYIIDNSELPRHLRLVFANIQWRKMNEHPIESVLIPDLRILLNKIDSDKNKKGQQSYNNDIKTDPTFQNNPEEVSYSIEQANNYYYSSRFEEAFSIYKRVAEQGNSEANYQIGIMYEKGEGVPKNPEEAVRWFRKAALQGNVSAQNSLGVRLALGKGVEKDINEAIEWITMAAKQGDSDAISNLELLARQSS